MPSARDIMMPSGAGCLVPRSERWFGGVGGASAQPLMPVESKSSNQGYQPRSEVLKRSSPQVARDNDWRDHRRLAPEASDLLMPNCEPEFHITVNRTESESLGIEVEHYTEKVLIVTRINEGLILSWNATHPGQKLEEEDLIVGVNDMTGDVHAILDECRLHKELKLAVRRPSYKFNAQKSVDVEYKITLDKSTGSKLGIDVNHENGSELFIESIDEGLINKWNTDNPDRPVIEEDRIIEVNGVRDNAKAMLAECMQDAILEVTLVRSEMRNDGQEQDKDRVPELQVPELQDDCKAKTEPAETEPAELLIDIGTD